jgi:hypothetical protein
MPSTRQTFLEDIFRARLRAIRVVDGFNTDAGEAVSLGEVVDLGPDDADAAVAIVPGDAQVKRDQALKFYVQLPVEIQLVAKVDLDEPWVLIEQMLADVQKAMELDDELIHGYERSLTYVGERVLPREAGMTTTGAGVTYLATFCRRWGQP